jgi:cobalt-zinc-cadmium efflux system membrane fusion protein
VELVLFEKDASKVHIGQVVEFTSPDRPDEVLKAKIKVVGKSINAQRQINVHADLIDEEEEAKLTPGMFLQARIQLDPQRSLAVPEESIIEVGEEHYILVQKSKSAGEGIRPDRIQVVGKGFREPMVANSSASNQALNRRITVSIQ